MIDHLYHDVSMAFPGRVISHIDVYEESDTYPILRIGFSGTRSELLFRSFLHARSQITALIESSLHDAEDLGLALPYDQIKDVLLAECKNMEVTPAGAVIVLSPVHLDAKNYNMRPPRPGVEGCLLRCDDLLARLIREADTRSRVGALDEPTTKTSRRKTLSVA